MVVSNKHKEDRAMKKIILSAVALASGLALLGGAAFAQWSGGPGWGHGYGMGPGMMRGAAPGWMTGGAPCAGYQEGAAQVTESRAREIATAYAAQYLNGFKVERVLPFAGRFRTMYSVELKNDAGETRILHVNPFGNVIPFGGPARSGS